MVASAGQVLGNRVCRMLSSALWLGLPGAAEDVGVDGEKCSEGMAQLLGNLDRVHALAEQKRWRGS